MCNSPAKVIDLSFGRDRAILENTYVINQPISDFVIFHDDSSCGEVLDKLLSHSRSEAAVINTDKQYLGIISIQDVVRQPAEQTITQLTRQNWPLFTETTTIWQAMQALQGFVGETIPVVSTKNQKLLGMISEAGLIEAYIETVHELRREENAAA